MSNIRDRAILRPLAGHILARNPNRLPGYGGKGVPLGVEEPPERANDPEMLPVAVDSGNSNRPIGLRRNERYDRGSGRHAAAPVGGSVELARPSAAFL